MSAIESRRPVFSSSTHPLAEPRSGPSTAAPLNRSRRDTQEASTDDLQDAQYLVQESDGELAKQYALALAFHDNSNAPSEALDPSRLTVNNIPPDSTFARVWKNSTTH